MVWLLLGRQYGYPPLQEAIEVGALRVYDRPQPTTRNYDQLLGSYSVREVIQ